MAITVDNLQIEIVSESVKATSALEALTATLIKLKSACKDGAGLNSVAQAMRKLNKELVGDNASSALNKTRREARKLKDEFSDATASAKEFALAIRSVGNVGFANERVSGFVEESTQVGFPNTDVGFWSGEMPETDYIEAEFREIDDTLSDTVQASMEATESFEKLDTELKKKPKDAKGASTAMNKVGEEVKKAGEKAKRSSSKFGQLLSSLKRIAMYRAIRSAMKAITSGISEGVKNLTYYSALIGDVDSAMAHSTTSEYATQFLYLKNSIGAAVAPMIQALLPTIKQVVAWFVQATNAVNQFISALQGKSTYTKAKEYAQDTAEGLQDAVGSAKELKKQLQGFDELNNLSFSEASGGANSTTPDYSQMFEEAEIDSKWKDIAKTFEDLLPIIEAIGLGILGWQLASPFLSELTAVNTALGKIANIAKGAILVTIGILLSYEGGIDLASDNVGTQIKGLVESTVGSALTAVGGYMIAGGIGLTVGVLLGIGATIYGLYEGTKEKCEKELKELFYGTKEGALLKQLQDRIDKTHENALNLKVRIDSITGEIDSETKVELETARTLVEEIFTLDAKDNKTATEISRIKLLIENLNTLGLDGIQLEFDETTGHVNKTKAEVTNLINELERQYRTEALKESLVELYKAETEATIGLEEAQGELTEALGLQETMETRVASATKEYDGALREFNKFCEDHALDTTADLSNGTDEVSKKFTELKKRVKSTDSILQMYEKGLSESKETTRKASEAVNTYSNCLVTSKSKITKYTGALNTMKNGIYDSVKAVSDMIEEWREFNNMNIAPKTISVDIQATINNAQASGLIRTEVLKNEDLNGNGIIGARSGGYVPNSSLFYANEDGNPEYVGNLNGHTAVANSGQMAEAIESASYRGMARALAENGGADGYEVIWDSQKVFGVMRKEASAYSKRTGNVAFS